MILPDKNITLENSLLGTGMLLLQELTIPQTFSSLWERSKNASTINSFEKFVLAMNLLYMLGLVDFKEGLLTKNDKSN